MEFVYMHMPKAAGISIIHALQGLPVTIIGHNSRDAKYVSLAKYRRNKDVYAFTFVRSPWDRVVSAFVYLNAGGQRENDEKDALKYVKKYQGDFDRFVKEGLAQAQNQVHFRPQHKWVSELDGSIIVDFVGKIEHLEEDLEKLREQTGLTVGEVPKKNSTAHKDYKEYYTEETKNIVAEMYKKDIELFGYEF